MKTLCRAFHAHMLRTTCARLLKSQWRRPIHTYRSPKNALNAYLHSHTRNLRNATVRGNMNRHFDIAPLTRLYSGVVANTSKNLSGPWTQVDISTSKEQLSVLPVSHELSLARGRFLNKSYAYRVRRTDDRSTSTAIEAEQTYPNDSWLRLTLNFKTSPELRNEYRLFQSSFPRLGEWNNIESEGVL